MIPHQSHTCEVIRLMDRQPRSGFSPRDLNDLAQWASGGRRIAIWDCDVGSFAMLYAANVPWASFAVARESGQVHAWDSVTLCDIGRFESMRQALAALPIDATMTMTLAYNVIPFRGTCHMERAGA